MKKVTTTTSKSQEYRKLTNALEESDKKLLEFNPDKCKTCPSSVNGAPCYKYAMELEYNQEVRKALEELYSS
ncbi:MAG: hypothetical protein LBG64_01040 [Pseudomonadales bacterium]|nr:hypothetical protein [Pseudomonadales bacterium]